MPCSRPLSTLLCAFRFLWQVVCACPSEKVGRQLIIHRGLHPLVIDHDDAARLDPNKAVNAAISMGFCGPRDVVVAVYLDQKASGQEPTLRVITVRECVKPWKG